MIQATMQKSNICAKIKSRPQYHIYDISYNTMRNMQINNGSVAISQITCSRAFFSNETLGIVIQIS